MKTQTHKEAIKEQALKFLKDKYQNKNNKLYFDETDLPLKTSIDKITKYMAEFASQQKEAEAVGFGSYLDDLYTPDDLMDDSWRLTHSNSNERWTTAELYQIWKEQNNG